MKFSKRRNLSKFYKINKICIIFLLTSMLSACVYNIDLRKLNQESKNYCPENMMYVNKDSFMMGSNNLSDESPIHEVSLEPYCIDKYEYPNNYGKKPEVGLSFFKAQELCISEGKRLCTEAEWELACRGPDNNNYPWGNQKDISKCYIGKIDDHRSGTYDYCFSGFGVFDMSGGVWEWTSDWYASYPGKVNEFDEIGMKKVLRGGFWLSSFDSAKCSSRFPLEPETENIPTIGARCCKSVEK